MENDSQLYYTPPSQEAFEDMKKACMAQWATHDNAHGYVDEKQGRIKDLANIQDNFMTMLAMFDIHGQAAVVKQLSRDTQDAVRERMVAGGNGDLYITTIGL